MAGAAAGVAVATKMAGAGSAVKESFSLTKSLISAGRQQGPGEGLRPMTHTEKIAKSLSGTVGNLGKAAFNNIGGKFTSSIANTSGGKLASDLRNQQVNSKLEKDSISGDPGPKNTQDNTQNNQDKKK